MANGLLRFPGQTKNEVTVDGQAEVVAIACKIAGPFHGCTLLDVLEYLRVAGLIADDQQTASGFTHGLQCFAVCRDARSAGQVNPSGFNLEQSSMVRAFWMLN